MGDFNKIYLCLMAKKYYFHNGILLKSENICMVRFPTHRQNQNSINQIGIQIYYMPVYVGFPDADVNLHTKMLKHSQPSIQTKNHQSHTYILYLIEI